MCLLIVKAAYQYQHEEELHGYKIFEDCGSKIEFPYQGEVAFVQDEWMNASHSILIANDGTNYISGFHVLPTLQDAREFAKGKPWKAVIYEVTYKGLIAEGEERNPYTDNMLDVLIVDRIKIGERVESFSPYSGLE